MLFYFDWMTAEIGLLCFGKVSDSYSLLTSTLGLKFAILSISFLSHAFEFTSIGLVPSVQSLVAFSAAALINLCLLCLALAKAAVRSPNTVKRTTKC